jgi:hypothetical protein
LEGLRGEDSNAELSRECPDHGATTTSGEIAGKVRFQEAAKTISTSDTGDVAAEAR